VLTTTIKPKAVLRARVIRADGTIQDLGVIAEPKVPVSWLRRFRRP